MGTAAILKDDSRTCLNNFQEFLSETPALAPLPSSSPYRHSLFLTLKYSPDAAAQEPRYKYKFRVYATKKFTGVADGSSEDQESSIRYDANTVGVLPMIQAMVACPTWTHGNLVFKQDTPIEPCFVPYLDSVMFEIFSHLCLHPTLTSLDIEFNPLSQVHVRPLLCSNLAIETLILTPGVMEVSYHAQSIADYLARNSVLKSCTLVLESFNFYTRPQMLWTLLSPLTRAVPNKALKEFVVRVAASNVPLGFFEDCVEKMVHCTTSLQKIELVFTRKPGDQTRSWRKVWFDRELRVFGLLCSTDELSNLESRVGIFNQAKSSFVSLHLCPASRLTGSFFMKSLNLYLMQGNLSFQHVHVASDTPGLQPWTAWAKSTDEERDVERGIQEMLKSMVCSEVKLNPILKSLHVGRWSLRREGDQWQSSYHGPCLLHREVAEEFSVKVKLKARGRHRRKWLGI